MSTGILWLRGSCGGRTVDRLLSGRELLHLQGFDAKKVGKMGRAFSQKEVVDLAGNAFCGPVLYAVVTALVACVPWAIASRAKPIAQALAAELVVVPALVSPAHSDEGSGDSEDDDADLLEEEAGESEEGSMSEDQLAGGSSAESISSFLKHD